MHVSPQTRATADETREGRLAEYREQLCRLNWLAGQMKPSWEFSARARHQEMLQRAARRVAALKAAIDAP
jgi:hypothetical protein